VTKIVFYFEIMKICIVGGVYFNSAQLGINGVFGLFKWIDTADFG